MRALAVATAAAGLALATSGADAVEVTDCENLGSPDAIIEPWEDNTRTFSNGKIRIAALDLIEPAAGAAWLMVLSPPYDELGARQCRMIGFAPGTGFAGIYFKEISADYDPAKGLTLNVPAQFYLPEEGFTNSILVRATINQATGDIGIETELGRE